MLGKPQCMSCNENPATVKITKVVKGTAEELWLCQQCAAQESPYQKKMAAMSLDQILAGILGAQKDEAATKPSNVELSCSFCGLPFESYRSTLLLGCSECYESFERYLISDLRKFHGSTEYKGRRPEGAAEQVAVPVPAPAPKLAPPSPPPPCDPQELRRRLREAVDAEDYELAAKIRDEIRQLELGEA
jgi:protein arginine kinase activator